MKNKYSVIAFDLGNTLIRFDHNISAGRIAKLFNLDPKKLYDAFFDSDITRAFERGEFSPQDFHKKISSHLGINLQYKDFVDIWNDIFWEDEGSCRIARELKKNYKLFLLSNISSLHFDYIRNKFEIISIFDELILSHNVGAIKPEPAIFEAVIKKAGGDKTKILYIDDREDLIREATAMGIDSIRFVSADNLKDLLRFKKVI